VALTDDVDGPAVLVDGELNLILGRWIAARYLDMVRTLLGWAAEKAESPEYE